MVVVLGVLVVVVVLGGVGVFWFGYWEVAYARFFMGWSVKAEIGTFVIPKVLCFSASVLSQVKMCLMS